MIGLQIDFISGDLLIANRAATVAPSDNFIAELVVSASRGDFKELPLLGAEAPLMLAGSPDPFWPGNTKKMLRACGLNISSLTVSPDGFIDIS